MTMIMCKKCKKKKPLYAKNLCKTCYNEPYILIFRKRDDYPEKNREYQQRHYIKRILEEFPDSA